MRLRPNGGRVLVCVTLAVLAGSFAAAAHAQTVTPTGIGSNTDNSSASSLAVTTTQAVAAGASIVVIAVDDDALGPPTSATCSDSAGDSFTTEVSQSSGSRLAVLCSAHALASQLASGSTVTVTFTGAGAATQDKVVRVFSVAGLAGSPLDRTASAAATSTTPSSGATATTTQASELLFGAIVDGNASVSAGGFAAGANGTSNNCAATGTTTYSSLGGVDVGGGDSTYGMYCVVSATGAYVAQATLANSDNYLALIASYKISATTSTTALSSSQNPQTAGQSVTLTATVTGDSPSGTVNFRDGGTTISGCGAQTVSSGTATCTTSSLSAGSHSLTAVYGGDATDTTSTSSTLTQTVNAAASAPAHAGVPGAPTGVSASAGDARATVSWTAPASDGGAAITAYTVTASPGGRTCSWSSGSLSCTVTGLANGTAYTFTVTAANSVGTGPGSAASNRVTPTSAPGAPTGVSAVVSDGQATVSCGAPTDDGGAAIGSYTATASPGGGHASAASCPITISGLTDGTTYTFTVTATNSAGTGPASAASSAVTPPDTHPPTSPIALTGRVSKGSLVLSWQAASDNVAVDHYQLYLNGTPIERILGTATSASLRDFDPHGASVYTLRAFDAAGNQSGPSITVTAEPAKRPSSAPKRIPHWAWRILVWQDHGRTGARPHAPTKLPAWYWAWKRWREHPFRLAT